MPQAPAPPELKATMAQLPKRRTEGSIASTLAREVPEAVPEREVGRREREESRAGFCARPPLRPDDHCALRDYAPVCAGHGCAPGAQRLPPAGDRMSAR